MSEEILKINKIFIEVLSAEKGYFGRIDTWGQRPTKYEYIGYELSEDILPTLEKMSEETRKNFVRIVTYFEIHANPLKRLLISEGHDLYQFYADISWSHFMTIIMFGMLEMAVRFNKEGKYRNGELINKGEAIKSFLERNLNSKIKDEIAKNYVTDAIFGYNKKIENFSDAVDHMWKQIRCEFIHKAGLESKGLEWTTLKGMGTKDQPITIAHDVPMQEWLKVTWQAILNSFGYEGILQLPKYKK